MTECARDLQRAVEQATPRLRSISEYQAATKPAPGKWSPKEIIGHLIDSAANNHGRFVRAQAMKDLVFDGYDADQWVAAQNYQSMPWIDLVDLWKNYNAHLVRVMAAAPDAERTRPRPVHNLDEISWKALPRERAATLEYLMTDYTGHLEHHLRQIPGL